MPRPKKTDAQRMAERFVELYKVGKAKAGLTDAQCAAIAGICRKSLSNAKKDPCDRISIGQLSKLGAVFGWTDEEYLAIFCSDGRR